MSEGRELLLMLAAHAKESSYGKETDAWRKRLDALVARVGGPHAIRMAPAPVSRHFTIGDWTLRLFTDGRVELMNAGEGGMFVEAELSDAIGQFVSERL